MVAFTSAMLAAGGAPLGPSVISGLLYGGTVVATSGFLILQWRLGRSEAPVALTILLGSVATSLFLTGACLLSGRSAGTMFVLWSMFVAFAGFRAFQEASPRQGIEGRDVAATIAIGLVVAAWCRPAASVLPTIRATGLVPIWSDYFIHASQIAQFATPLGTGGSFLMMGEPVLLYHYASYMLPAAMAGLAGLPAMGLATSILLPYGVLLAALGIYAFARTMGSQPVAVIAPIALMLLQDSSTYGFRNGFFGFHWLLFTSPGTGYGIGVAFAALTTMAMWRADRRPSILALGLGMTAALFMFRVHFLILFAPALAMALLWETDFARQNRRAILFGILVTAVACALVVATVPAARHAWRGLSAFVPFMETVHTQMGPTAYDGFYRTIEQHYGRMFVWLIGLGALIPIVLGGLTLAAPIAQLAAVRRTGWQPLDSFPMACTATWLGLVVFAPYSALDGTEYQHRPFVLVYAVVFVWTLVWLDRVVRSARGGRSRALFVFNALAVAAVCAGGATGWERNPAAPRFSWGSGFFGTTLDRGLLEVADFVRSRAESGDIFALIPTDEQRTVDDAPTRFAALADVPAYLALPRMQASHSAGRRATVEQRLAVMKRIENSNDPDAVFRELRTIGVRFLVVLGERGPRFNPDGSLSAFRTGGAVVYRIE